MRQPSVLDLPRVSFQETMENLQLSESELESIQRRLDRDGHLRGEDEPSFRERTFDENDEGPLHYHPLLLIAEDEFERRVWLNGMWGVVAESMKLPARIELENVRLIFVFGGGRYAVNFLAPDQKWRDYHNFYQLGVDVTPSPLVVNWSIIEHHMGQSPEEVLNLVRRFANGWEEASRRKLVSLFKR